MNRVLCCVFHCILLSAFIGHSTEYTKMHGMSNTKKRKLNSMLQSRICRACTQLNNSAI